MNYKIAEARARRGERSRSDIVEGELVYRCGHREPYRSSVYGFVLVSGMSMAVDCGKCNDEFNSTREEV